MTLHHGIHGFGPVSPEPIRTPSRTTRDHRAASPRLLGVGTLACPACDAPLAPLPGVMSPSDPVGCGFCQYAAAVRDFLSLAAPSRPARVEVRVVQRARG